MAFVKLPNGYTATCSEAVARIWARRPGYLRVEKMPAWNPGVAPIIDAKKKDAPELDLAKGGAE